jgi:hypothetical protein
MHRQGGGWPEAGLSWIVAVLGVVWDRADSISADMGSRWPRSHPPDFPLPARMATSSSRQISQRQPMAAAARARADPGWGCDSSARGRTSVCTGIGRGPPTWRPAPAAASPFGSMSGQGGPINGSLRSAAEVEAIGHRYEASAAAAEGGSLSCSAPPGDPQLMAPGLGLRLPSLHWADHEQIR